MGLEYLVLKVHHFEPVVRLTLHNLDMSRTFFEDGRWRL
jgi:hypothetical protein